MSRPPARVLTLVHARARAPAAGRSRTPRRTFALAATDVDHDVSVAGWTDPLNVNYTALYTTHLAACQCTQGFTSLREEAERSGGGLR